jgi:predicted HD phosphohydrolase
VRVIKANEILYQFIADPFHQEGLQIWIWDELR